MDTPESECENVVVLPVWAAPGTARGGVETNCVPVPLPDFILLLPYDVTLTPRYLCIVSFLFYKFTVVCMHTVPGTAGMYIKRHGI